MDAERFLEKAEKHVDLMFSSVAVLPGDDVTTNVTGFQKNIKIGAGLTCQGQSVISNICGNLKYRTPTTYWVDCGKKRYIPKTGDQIIGVIDERGGEFYRVNVFGASSALLNRLSFEGATKRNKPELKKGDIVYARVSLAHKDFDTELTCITTTGSKKEWSSGETVYGELSEGLLLRVSIGKARSMLLPDCVVLNALGRHFAFEVAIGVNGVVWIRSAGVYETIVIRNAIINSEHLDDLETEGMVEALAQRAKLGNN